MTITAVCLLVINKRSGAALMVTICLYTKTPLDLSVSDMPLFVPCIEPEEK